MGRGMVNNGDLVAILSFLTVLIELFLGVAQRVYGNFTALVKDKVRLENEVRQLKTERDSLRQENERLQTELIKYHKRKSWWYRLKRGNTHGRL
jgi:cell division protein FtsB